jgi:hypothetical protein
MFKNNNQMDKAFNINQLKQIQIRNYYENQVYS